MKIQSFLFEKRWFFNLISLCWFLFLASGCATLPTNFERPLSYAFSDTQDTLIGRKVADDIAANLGQSGFFLLSNGLDAFVARALLAHFAERSIDVQYYLYHNDLVGGLFTHQLRKAADRGVRVRLLVDDMDLEGRDSGVAALDAHPDIEVRIFNPFSVAALSGVVGSDQAIMLISARCRVGPSHHADILSKTSQGYMF